MTVIGTDSKTIKIRGLPFRGTPLDILNFFEVGALAAALPGSRPWLHSPAPWAGHVPAPSYA